MLTKKLTQYMPTLRTKTCKVPKAELQALLTKHRLGQLEKLSLMSSHPSFSIYQVDTDTDSFVAYLYMNEEEHSLAFIEELFAFLRTKDLPVPMLLFSEPCSLGRLLLWNRCLGKAQFPWSFDQCYSLGFHTALLHETCQNFTPKTFKPPILIQLKNRLYQEIEYLPRGFFPLINEIEFLERHWPSSLPHGLIHSDIWEKNILFIREDVSAFLDPQAYQIDLLVCDLASVVKQLYFSASVKNPDELFHSFLKGYRSIRSPLEEEYENLGLALRTKFLLTIFIMLEKARSTPSRRELYLNNATLNLMKLYEAQNISFTKNRH